MTQGTARRSGRGLPTPEELRNNGVVKNVGEAPRRRNSRPVSGPPATVSARSVLDHGPSTVAELAGRLGLTQAAVRRHLDALVADDVVEAREQRVYGTRTRGRPAKVFALTDCGRDASTSRTTSWRATPCAGSAGRRAGAGDRRLRPRPDRRPGRCVPKAVESVPPEKRTEALAKALSADGYAATARERTPPPSRASSCASTMPGRPRRRSSFPQLCEAETEFFAELLGTHAQRLATIAHGDGVCTTFIPKTSHAPPPRRKRPRTPLTHPASTAGRNPA